MQLSDFTFDLPDELIAQEPPPVRGESRLMVLRRDGTASEHTTFSRLGEYLRRGDLLVLNNTKVFPARLLGRRVPSGGAVECLLLRQIPNSKSQIPDSTPTGSEWEALVHPGQKLKPGAQVVFEGDDVRLHGEILARHFHGRRTVRLRAEGHEDVMAAVERIGHVPLPPYITREDRPFDRERYQTVFAKSSGSIAAPTAGLHFTSDVLARLASQGVERTEVTLHVGYGTFKPIRTGRIDDHEVDPERYIVTPDAAAALTRARADGRRIVAVGTTSVRVLESLAWGPAGRIEASSGETHLFIRPGHEFRLVDALLTNFHLPRSSLLVLVAALAGRTRLLEAYRDAVARQYRFYSYGDAMLIV
ncbi:MAG: tRNA preQ1(34) S-adenosylmethionine ribosyltransferase-isomerase QueA [Acidobacteria bacterium RIFCSPLOWO2_02_FULL_67_21]|nr:MAG: tRNA preQ1(34) S-adenosylmethionine ribosyltransferase-isomerase QueA [Acidobacteria bacterium RIFCSPLOWO2_02_FULL_67_21]